MDTILDCGHPPSPHSDITNGYGTTSDGKKHCYACCALRDKERMEKDGKIYLYLVHNTTKINNPLWEITNWPGSLRFPVRILKMGRHNIAGTRYDVWFTDTHGNAWHGVQYGDNTQVAHCRKLKSA